MKFFFRCLNFFDELESWQQAGTETMNETLESIENGSW
jgi:hypothetical protein